MRILLVEDDGDVREYMTEVLDAAGCYVIAAGDANEALRLAERDTAIDLVITDIVMPGVDGLALVRALRRSHPTLKVLFTTGYSRHIAPDEFADEEILEKPFHREVLLHAINRLSGLEIA